MDTVQPGRRWGGVGGFSGLGILLALIVVGVVLFLYFGNAGTNKSYMQNVVESKKRGEDMNLTIQAQQLAALVVDYRMNHNDRAPTSFEDLGVDASSFRDVWGQTMTFRVAPAGAGKPGSVELISSGPDQKPGTEDDITASSPLPL